MTSHSSTLAWKPPRTEEPGRLQSMGVAKTSTWLSDFTFTFHFPALEKEMATHSSVLAWRIPGTGEPGGLPSLGSHRVEHDWSDLAAAAAAAAAAEWEKIVGFHLCIAKYFCIFYLKFYRNIFVKSKQILKSINKIWFPWFTLSNDAYLPVS